MSTAESTPTRKLVYAIFIVVAAGAVAGHIASATRVYDPQNYRDENHPDPRRTGKWPATRPKPMPNFGSNDTSRWATVRALVDEGTYVIGRRDPKNPDPATRDTGITFEDGWFSIDKVLHPQKMEFYSSKPPLLSTLVAGLYWLLQRLTGWTLKDDPFSVIRTILLLINLLPFVIYLALMAKVLDRRAGTDWGRFFILAAACFATLMTPFMVTFNNHTIASCCVLFALYPVMPSLRFPWNRQPGGPSALALAVSGLFAGMTAATELPAASFACLLFALLLFQAPGRTLLCFLPLALLPMATELCLNYIALGELDFAYSKFGSEWYEYPGSVWQKPLPGQVKYTVDFAYLHESRGTYVFHVLLGHHGLFTLTPLWLLAFAGMIWAVVAAPRKDVETSRTESAASPEWSALACMTLIVSVVVIGFYLITTSNYGGGTSGLRWLMWISPLWLLTMIPVVDWLGQRRWGRWLSLFMLFCSVFSVAFPTWNPWRHPWIYYLMDSWGEIPY